MDGEGAGRANQRRRTRKDLLQAAARLMKHGQNPSLEEIADEAMVSRATAYRYFPGVEALLVEASLDLAVPDADALFRNDSSSDPVERLNLVDTTLHDMILANEPSLRMMLVHSLQRVVKGGGDSDIPPRQNRRSPLIEAALKPERNEFDPAALKLLHKALALIIGTEGIVVFKDVLQTSDTEARKVKQWAIRALVDAARKPRRRT
ncbi:TetR/AcrR family transcriptional regulator [Taklimakanibacter deserti]|uniref:TetR/AcrR family transcriptional regulator n=1 Tax=Taklimakanibacter deserti TaxID=2267839 RepID=UPI000E65A100